MTGLSEDGAAPLERAERLYRKIRSPLRIGGLIVAGAATPPLVLTLTLWFVLLMMGMHRNDIVGILGHFLAARYRVEIERADILLDPSVDAGHYGEATRNFESLGFSQERDLKVSRGGYKAYLRVFLGPDKKTMGFILQTLYIQAPPANDHFINVCANGTVVETTNELETEGDPVVPKWLHITLHNEKTVPELYEIHKAEIKRACGSNPTLTPMSDEGFENFVKRDRDWWFDNCAPDLATLARGCIAEEETGRIKTEKVVQ